MILQWARFILAAMLMFAGLLILFATTMGLFRFHYVLNRVQAAAKCDTFGVLLTFSSLMVIFGWSIESLKLVLIVVFLWIANPVSSHLIAHLEFATNPKIREELTAIHYGAD